MGSEYDFVTGYLKHVLAFIGLSDVTFIDSSGLMLDAEKAEKAQEEIAAVA